MTRNMRLESRDSTTMDQPYSCMQTCSEPVESPLSSSNREAFASGSTFTSIRYRFPIEPQQLYRYARVWEYSIDITIYVVIAREARHRQDSPSAYRADTNNETVTIHVTTFTPHSAQTTGLRYVSDGVGDVPR